jgi:hypothetical protein
MNNNNSIYCKIPQPFDLPVRNDIQFVKIKIATKFHLNIPFREIDVKNKSIIISSWFLYASLKKNQLHKFWPIVTVDYYKMLVLRDIQSKISSKYDTADLLVILAKNTTIDGIISLSDAFSRNLSLLEIYVLMDIFPINFIIFNDNEAILYTLVDSFRPVALFKFESTSDMTYEGIVADSTVYNDIFNSNRCERI